MERNTHSMSAENRDEIIEQIKAEGDTPTERLRLWQDHFRARAQ